MIDVPAHTLTGPPDIETVHAEASVLKKPPFHSKSLISLPYRVIIVRKRYHLENMQLSVDCKGDKEECTSRFLVDGGLPSS